MTMMMLPTISISEIRSRSINNLQIVTVLTKHLLSMTAILVTAILIIAKSPFGLRNVLIHDKVTFVLPYSTICGYSCQNPHGPIPIIIHSRRVQTTRRASMPFLHCSNSTRPRNNNETRARQQRERKRRKRRTTIGM